jgi:hypothetical protein
MRSLTTDLWENSSSTLTDRSRLFSLEPIGTGTGLIESITSYIARLAEAHSVSTGSLVAHEIAPHASKRGMAYDNGHCDLFGNVGGSINGNNGTAADMIRILEAVTGLSNLRRLTMLPFADVLSCSGLLRDKRAWCPQCLHEWREAGTTIYEPLIWNLKQVVTCPRHHIPLVLLCPACGKSFRPLSRYFQPGHCGICQNWLGLERYSGPNDLPHEVFAAEQAQSLIFDGQTSVRARTQFRNNIGTLIKCVNHVEGFSRFVGSHSKTVNGWKDGTHTPKLETVLRVAFCFGINATALLFEPLRDSDLDRIQRHRAAHRRSNRRYDKAKIYGALKQALASPWTCRSVAAISRELQYNPGHVARLFPKEAQQVSKRFQQIASQKKTQRREQIQQTVTDTVLRLHAKGVYPSRGKVAAQLPRLVSLRHAVARNAWKSTLKELNYERPE